MSTSPLSVIGQPTRSLEWLFGPDALLSSTALSTGQLGALGPIASLIDSGVDAPLTESAVSDLTGSATDIANQAVLDVHAGLESVGHEVTPLNGPLHALTALGETVGLGKIGEPGHLLTDLSVVPAAVADGGGLASVSPALSDLGNVLGATDGLIASVADTVTARNLLASDGALAPVSNLANAAILDVHANIEGLGHDIPVLNEALHGLTNLGETVGLGKLGESGTLLTDVAALPSDLLHGDGLASLSPILGDLGSVTGAATGLLDDVVSIPSGLLGSGTPLDGVLGGLTGDGGGVLAPVTSVIDGVTGGLVGGDGGVLAPITAVLDGVTGGQAGTPVDGVLGGLTGDGGGVLAPVTSVVDGVTGGLVGGDGGVLAPVTAVLDSVTGGQAGTPVDGVLGGLTGTDGGVLAPITGVLGSLTGGGSEGTHPLIDVAAGPTTSTPTADVAVLTPSAEPSHTIQVGAVGVGADQSSLVSAGLLSGDGIAFPSTGGTGADALVGHALDIVQTAAPGSADADASHSAGIDLGIAAIDLGGHVDAQHTDPTPHGATSGLHLLGL